MIAHARWYDCQFAPASASACNYKKVRKSACVVAASTTLMAFAFIPVVAVRHVKMFCLHAIAHRPVPNRAGHVARFDKVSSAHSPVTTNTAKAHCGPTTFAQMSARTCADRLNTGDSRASTISVPAAAPSANGCDRAPTCRELKPTGPHFWRASLPKATTERCSVPTSPCSSSGSSTSDPLSDVSNSRSSNSAEHRASRFITAYVRSQRTTCGTASDDDGSEDRPPLHCGAKQRASPCRIGTCAANRAAVVGWTGPPKQLPVAASAVALKRPRPTPTACTTQTPAELWRAVLKRSRHT